MRIVKGKGGGLICFEGANTLMYGWNFDVYDFDDVAICTGYRGMPSQNDSEVLVAEAIDKHPDAQTILDVGTGSGCIAITLQRLLPNSTVTATDISIAALTIARRNGENLGIPIEFLHGNLYEPVAGRSFDLIVSNPPYIPTADIATLEPEVKSYDPRIALDGGVDGLAVYRSLIQGAPQFLNPGGWLLCEIGVGQSCDVSSLLFTTGCFHEPIIVNDASSIPRVVAAHRKD